MNDHDEYTTIPTRDLEISIQVNNTVLGLHKTRVLHKPSAYQAPAGVAIVIAEQILRELRDPLAKTILTEMSATE